MKWAAEHDVVGIGVFHGQLGESEGVAAGVCPCDHLVALVVVAEDVDPVAQGLPGRPDPGVVGRVIGYEPLRERCLESQHVEALEPLCGTPDYRPVGAAWTPHHGVVGLGC
jgi:hypothetical protein